MSWKLSTASLFVFECGCAARCRYTVMEKQRGENNRRLVRRDLLNCFDFSLYRLTTRGIREVLVPCLANGADLGMAECQFAVSHHFGPD